MFGTVLSQTMVYLKGDLEIRILSEFNLIMQSVPSMQHLTHWMKSSKEVVDIQNVTSHLSIRQADLSTSLPHFHFKQCFK